MGIFSTLAQINESVCACVRDVPGSDGASFIAVPRRRPMAQLGAQTPQSRQSTTVREKGSVASTPAIAPELRMKASCKQRKRRLRVIGQVDEIDARAGPVQQGSAKCSSAKKRTARRTLWIWRSGPSWRNCGAISPRFRVPSRTSLRFQTPSAGRTMRDRIAETAQRLREETHVGGARIRDYVSQRFDATLASLEDRNAAVLRGLLTGAPFLCSSG